jgi:hypothetical protein
MNIRKSLPVIGYTSWCFLGFVRGVNSYTYNNNYNNKHGIQKDYVYLHSVCYGFFGMIVYFNPILLPFSLYKEIYRAEVNLRSLENEKTTGAYNNVLIFI